jgi:phosphoenolpyruvate synthase/pyruvate phosphate dikinase
MEAVHIPSWLPLARLSLYPQDQVGEWGSTLAKLQQIGVPLSPTLVIPVRTLQDIADHNHLIEKLEKKLGTATLFSHLKIPTEVASELLTAYHEIIGIGLAEVRLSPVQAFSGSDELVLSCIDGDTNTFESLFQIWAEAYALTGNLIPGAIVIRRHSQPSSSGIALTKDTETETKTQVALFSTWGATTTRPNLAQYDHFKVDVRTWNTLFSQIAEKSYLYVCQPERLGEVAVAAKLQHMASLSESQIIDLAKLVHQIKLHNLHHCQLAWEVVSGQFVITNLTRLDAPHEVQGLPHPHSALLTGTTIVQGVVEGVCYLGLPSAGPQSLPRNTILVLKQFTPQAKQYLGAISALIVEQPLPQFVHDLVKQLHLPTLSHINGAHRYVHQGQTVVVDATSGHVFSANSQLTHSPTAGSTLTKVWVAASNPEKAADTLTPAVGGVVFNANLSFAQFGEHPLHLIKTDRRHQVIQGLVKAIEAYKPKHRFPLLYKPVDITSDDLLEFMHSGSYEQLEPNPYLGYRGSLRLSHSFEVFDAELEALTEVINRNHQHLGLIIPLTRTPAELRTVITHVRHQVQVPSSQLELWWQICTPENIALLDHYVSPQLSGVIISVRDLHSLMYGIDPSNPDVYARYPVNVTLMRDLIIRVAKTCQQHQVLIQTDDDYSQLSDLAVELRLAGVIVKSSQVQKTKQLILEAEQHQLSG